MFIDRAHRAELEMLVPAHAEYSLPWRWLAAVALVFVVFAVSAL